MTTEEFLAFAEPLPEAILLLTDGGCVLGANSAAGTLLGRQITGRWLEELVAESPEAIAARLRLWSGVRQPLPATLQWRIDGDLLNTRCDAALVDPRLTPGARWIVLRCVPQQDAIRQFGLLNEQIAALAREVSERRRYESALRSSQAELHDSHELLENVLESIGDAFCALDTEGRFLYANQKTAQLAGSTPTELAGKSAWNSLPRAGGIFERELRGAIAARQPAHFETWLEDRGICLENDAYPTSTGVALFLRDVTERRKFEDNLQQTQKLESLGVLAGGLAHDFNNLLTGILGNACLALEDLPPDSPARSSVRDVMEAAERAADLTRQLLAYAGKGRFVVEPVEVSGLVEQISRLIQAGVPGNVDLQLRLGRSLPPVEADPAQMQQLVMNLVINAAEAIGDTSGTVVVSTGRQHVTEESARAVLPSQELAAGDYVSLEVRDTGAGMTEDVMARIFDPFFTTKRSGRGLGLAAVLGIVRGHKGGLKVNSTPGHGTTFTVLLPASGRTVAAKVAAERCIGAGSGQTVLVVDDEAVIRRTAQSMLERFGYRVLTASNGQEAVEIFRAAPASIAVVLLDVTMPVMSGEAAFHEIKAIDAGARVLLSSGYNEVETVRRFAGTSLAGFLRKPYSVARLLAKVEAALRR